MEAITNQEGMNILLETSCLELRPLNLTAYATGALYKRKMVGDDIQRKNKLRVSYLLAWIFMLQYQLLRDELLTSLDFCASISTI